MENTNNQFTELDPPNEPKNPNDKLFWIFFALAWFIGVVGTIISFKLF